MLLLVKKLFGIAISNNELQGGFGLLCCCNVAYLPDKCSNGKYLLFKNGKTETCPLPAPFPKAPGGPKALLPLQNLKRKADREWVE